MRARRSSRQPRRGGAIERGALIFVVASSLAAAPVQGAQATSSRTMPAEATNASADELAWVGLFNEEMLTWINNLNVMDLLCEQPPGSEAWNACRDAHMEPRVLVIPVRDAPVPAATRLGELVVVARPGSALQVHASDGRIAEPFTPDLYLADWGYGPPYFHLTVLERHDSWFRVPIPVIGAGWVNGDDWRGASPRYPHIERLQVDGSVITTPRGDMVVLAVEDRVLRARPEQASDMWCELGSPPPTAPWEEVRIPFEELFNAAGRLLIFPKYMKGC